MARPRLDRPVYRLRRRGGVHHIFWTEAGQTRSASTRETDPGRAGQYLSRFVAAREDAPPADAPTITAILDGYATSRNGRIASTDTLEFSARPIKAALGDLLAGDLTEATIERYAEMRRRAPGTIIRELGTLRAALHWAVRRHWIASAPKFLMPVPHPPPRDRWLTRDEAGRLIAECRAPHLRLFVLLALTTAARRGAILDLTWRGVDLDAGRIDFGEGRGNKRRSVVPVNATLAPELAAQHEARRTDHVIEYRGRAVTTVRQGFNAAAARAKIPACTPHTMRHTAATWMVMEGVPLAKVARYLGDSERTVETVYGKHSPDYLIEASQALEI